MPFPDKNETIDLKPSQRVALDIAASYPTVITAYKNMYTPRVGSIRGQDAKKLIALGYLEVVSYVKRECKITPEGRERAATKTG